MFSLTTLFAIEVVYMSDQVIIKEVKNNCTDKDGNKLPDSVFINVCPACGSQLFDYRCYVCGNFV